jgi:hypothetical protein
MLDIRLRFGVLESAVHFAVGLVAGALGMWHIVVLAAGALCELGQWFFGADLSGRGLLVPACAVAAASVTRLYLLLRRRTPSFAYGMAMGAGAATLPLLFIALCYLIGFPG